MLGCWQDYVKATKTDKENKGLTHKEIIKLASDKYKRDKQKAVEEAVCEPAKVLSKLYVKPERKTKKKEPIVKKPLKITLKKERERKKVARTIIEPVVEGVMEELQVKPQRQRKKAMVKYIEPVVEGVLEELQMECVKQKKTPKVTLKKETTGDIQKIYNKVIRHYRKKTDYSSLDEFLTQREIKILENNKNDVLVKEIYELEKKEVKRVIENQLNIKAVQDRIENIYEKIHDEYGTFSGNPDFTLQNIKNILSDDDYKFFFIDNKKNSYVELIMGNLDLNKKSIEEEESKKKEVSKEDSNIQLRELTEKILSNSSDLGTLQNYVHFIMENLTDKQQKDFKINLGNNWSKLLPKIVKEYLTKSGKGIHIKLSPWIQHVKSYQKANNVPYNVALKEAKQTYKKGKGLIKGYVKYTPKNITGNTKLSPEEREEQLDIYRHKTLENKIMDKFEEGNYNLGEFLTKREIKKLYKNEELAQKINNILVEKELEEDDEEEDVEEDEEEDDEEGQGFRPVDDYQIYKNNPNIQFSMRGGIIKQNPNIQNVNLLTKQKPLKIYGGYCCSGTGALNTAVVIEGLEKTGLFQASKDVLKSLTNKFDEWLKNPSATRQHRIITRIIPDLTYKYEKLKNELEVFGNQWKSFRINNHKIAMLNTEDKIKSLLMELNAL